MGSIEVDPFVISQVGTPGLYALSMAVVVAAIYLCVVRFMDLNEKEPLWAVGLLFALGMLAAAVMPLVVGSAARELSVVVGAMSDEVARFAAFAAGAAALAAVSSSRGWSEMGGVMDGVVYGTAVGFGFATGTVFVRELSAGGVMEAASGGDPFATLWTTALSGLSDGLFGAIIGVGFGAAAVSRSRAGRLGYPLAGLVGAIVAHALYLVLARGNALAGGAEAVARTWAALLLPLVFIVAVVGIALIRERRAIREELSGEEAVSEEDHAVLRSFAARRSLYARALLSGKLDEWVSLRTLHNRQVQLALAKRRLGREGDAGGRANVEGEVERLRAEALRLKKGASLADTSLDSGKAGV